MNILSLILIFYFSELILILELSQCFSVFLLSMFSFPFCFPVAALRFSIDWFEMPNKTIYWLIELFLQNVGYIFFTAAYKVDGLDETIHRNW